MVGTAPSHPSLPATDNPEDIKIIDDPREHKTHPSSLWGLPARLFPGSPKKFRRTPPWQKANAPKEQGKPTESPMSPLLSRKRPWPTLFPPRDAYYVEDDDGNFTRAKRPRGLGEETAKVPVITKPLEYIDLTVDDDGCNDGDHIPTASPEPRRQVLPARAPTPHLPTPLSQPSSPPPVRDLPSVYTPTPYPVPHPHPRTHRFYLPSMRSRPPSARPSQPHQDDEPGSQVPPTPTPASAQPVVPVHQKWGSSFIPPYQAQSGPGPSFGPPPSASTPATAPAPRLRSDSMFWPAPPRGYTTPDPNPNTAPTNVAHNSNNEKEHDNPADAFLDILSHHISTSTAPSRQGQQPQPGRENAPEILTPVVPAPAGSSEITELKEQIRAEKSDGEKMAPWTAWMHEANLECQKGGVADDATSTADWVHGSSGRGLEDAQGSVFSGGGDGDGDDGSGTARTILEKELERRVEREAEELVEGGIMTGRGADDGDDEEEEEEDDNDEMGGLRVKVWNGRAIIEASNTRALVGSVSNNRGSTAFWPFSEADSHQCTPGNYLDTPYYAKYHGPWNLLPAQRYLNTTSHWNMLGSYTYQGEEDEEEEEEESEMDGGEDEDSSPDFVTDSSSEADSDSGASSVTLDGHRKPGYEDMMEYCWDTEDYMTGSDSELEGEQREVEPEKEKEERGANDGDRTSNPEVAEKEASGSDDDVSEHEDSRPEEKDQSATNTHTNQDQARVSISYENEDRIETLRPAVEPLSPLVQDGDCDADEDSGKDIDTEKRDEADDEDSADDTDTDSDTEQGPDGVHQQPPVSSSTTKTVLPPVAFWALPPPMIRCYNDDRENTRTYNHDHDGQAVRGHGHDNVAPQQQQQQQHYLAITENQGRDEIEVEEEAAGMQDGGLKFSVSGDEEQAGEDGEEGEDGDEKSDEKDSLFDSPEDMQDLGFSDFSDGVGGQTEGEEDESGDDEDDEGGDDE